MTNKIKVLTISDHPLSPSGVGTQTKYIIEALLKTGKFEVVSLGGAIKHPSYQPQKTEQYGDDWRIFPVDGYGNEEIIRSVLRTERPDMLWFMTDPRFYGWLWNMAQEIRPIVPMVYYHVWDNWPAPVFNKKFYDSNDEIVAISKVTRDIVAAVSPDVELTYLPHACDSEVFKPLSDEDTTKFRSEFLQQPERENSTIFFWNNRNARRKQSGTVLQWFKEWLDEVGHDQATLIMHTDPKDQHGQDLVYMMDSLNLTEGQVRLSVQKYPPDVLARMYNIADCTINIADAEGFGLATLESLSCATPIIVTMTGGLQEQVTDGENWFGIGIEPSSKACIGSQQVPFIYEDRISQEDFTAALNKIHNMSKEDRTKLGTAGRQHVLDNYGYEKYTNSWVEFMEAAHEKHGSWDTRKNYKGWELITL